MADFKGRKRGRSHVQNMGIFFGDSEHGPESSCQISAYYKFFLGLHVFCRISTGLNTFSKFMMTLFYFGNLVFNFENQIGKIKLIN